MNEDGLELPVERRLRARFQAEAGSWDPEPAVPSVMQRVRAETRGSARRTLMVPAAAGVLAVAMIATVATGILSTRLPGEQGAQAPPGAQRSDDAGICYQQLYVPPPSLDPRELDALIETAGGPERKLSPDMYAGSAEGAARAFGGTLGEPRSSRYEWINVETDRGLMLLLLRRFDSAARVPVWVAGDTAWPKPCTRSGPTQTPRPTLGPDGPRPSMAFQLSTHCLDRSPIFFDGSYWRPLGEPDGPLADPFDQGTMTLLRHDRAAYESESGTKLLLERLLERPSFPPCR